MFRNLQNMFIGIFYTIVANVKQKNEKRKSYGTFCKPHLYT